MPFCPFNSLLEPFQTAVAIRTDFLNWISLAFPLVSERVKIKRHLLFFHIIIGIFGLYRITKRTYEDNPESTFTPLPRNITPLGIELDPTTGADISSSEKK